MIQLTTKIEGSLFLGRHLIRVNAIVYQEGNYIRPASVPINSECKKMVKI